VNRRDEGRAALLRAFELDPEYADALFLLAASYENDDKDRAVDYASRCLEISPSAGSCLRMRAGVYLDRGQCAKLEADARTMTIVEPNGRRAYLFLARALAAENAPLEAIEEALRKRAAVTTDGDMRSEVTMENSLAVALLAGDLLAAEAAARRGMALADGAQLESEHAPPLEVLLDVLEERGEPERALAEGEAFERHAAAWTADAPFGAHVRVLFLRNELGRTDLPTLNATLGALHDKQVARGGWPFCWTSEEGLFVSGAEQASRVLAEVPDSGGWRTSSFFPVGLGRTLLVAGQPAAAVEPLRAAANSCGILTDELGPAFYSGTIWWMRAHVLLGQALEQTGDTAGACAAYAVVMDRWKNAKPRSITLDKARERSRGLECPKP
jgi:tetratricopeptide (TPR) repeat protein